MLEVPTVLTGGQLDSKSLHVSISKLLLELILFGFVLHPYGANFVVLDFLLDLLFFSGFIVDGMLFEWIRELDHLSPLIVALGHNHAILMVCLRQCIRDAFHTKT